MVAHRTEERETLKSGGRLLGAVLAEVVAAVRPGVAIRDLDALAEEKIRACGGSPAFKGYRPSRVRSAFPGTLCISVNDEIVHGVPTRPTVLREGDIVGLDIGMQWPASREGLYTDTAVSVPVGAVSSEASRLIDVTREALDVGITQARIGNRLRDIGKAVQHHVEQHGFGVVRALVGHGVGAAVHEPPQVPNFWDRDQKDAVLTDGFVIAIEPMVTAGSWEVVQRPDGWTIVTADHSLAAHFEHTVLITREGTEVLTRVG